MATHWPLCFFSSLSSCKSCLGLAAQQYAFIRVRALNSCCSVRGAVAGLTRWECSLLNHNIGNIQASAMSPTSTVFGVAQLSPDQSFQQRLLTAIQRAPPLWRFTLVEPSIRTRVQTARCHITLNYNSTSVEPTRSILSVLHQLWLAYRDQSHCICVLPGMESGCTGRCEGPREATQAGKPPAHR